jgi:murein tripeptide amidase MpaA
MFGSEGELISQQTVENEQMFRLPDGYKSHIYAFELVGNAPVYSLAVADTAKALAQEQMSG